MVKTYRRRPAEVDVMQWTGTNMKELGLFMCQHFVSHSPAGGLLVEIRKKELRIDPGVWIIKDGLGEFSLCENNKFLREYELVE